MKVAIRVLVYEGDEDWLKTSLDNRSIKKKFVCSYGTITEHFAKRPLAELWAKHKGMSVREETEWDSQNK